MILLVDNYDSFVWNLQHGLTLGARAAGVDDRVTVVRNDAIDPDAARAMRPAAIVLSPGPCGPSDAGACVPLVRDLAGEIPILGVCLGHQAIAAAFGMRVVRSGEPVHGKRWTVEHDGRTVFEGLPSPLRVGRYHSLVVPEADVRTARDARGSWEVSSRTPEGVVMGLRREWTVPGRTAVEGVQFHPESYLTEHGQAMLTNFLRCAGASPAPALAGTIAAR